MTLRKCIFDIENYSERGSRLLGTTTEIIYKPRNLYFRGFYISTRMNARTIMYHCWKRPCIESSQI